MLEPKRNQSSVGSSNTPTRLDERAARVSSPFAGLMGALKVQTLVGEVQAPLGQDMYAALAALFEMLWGREQPGVSPQDWQDYQRLCLPGSPDFILDLPDYYAFYTYTMFRGRVPR